MIEWVLLASGSVLGFAGMTLAVSSRAMGQMELYRLVAARTEAAEAARTLLAAPGRVIGAALGVSAMGAALAGMGARVILLGLPLWLLSLTVLAVAVPLFLSLVYAIPRAAGRRWAESVIKSAVPVFARLAVFLAPLHPGPDNRDRGGPQPGESPEDEDRGDSEQLTLVSGVLKFSERPVKEVMTQRTDINAVQEGATVAEIGRAFADSRYSRVPVYRDSLDNIVGMVYAFDLLKLNPGAELAVRPVTVVHGSKPCADLLFEMQRDRHAMAVVLDEYGGTAGIATLQDLLEELVGETFETVEAAATLQGTSGAVVEVLGTAPAEDLARMFEVRLPENAETVGGLLSRAAGRIPRAGERYELAGLEFDVLVATATRVERVAVRRGSPPVIRLSPGSAR
jgi:CBS domain containing-hemolysin-like protein